MNTKDIGLLSQLIVYKKLVSMGCIISEPFGDNAPYDVIVDNGKKLLKVQIKTTEKITKNGSFRVSLCKRVGAQRLGREGYRDLDIDFVVAYSREFNEIYCIDLHKYTQNEITLRKRDAVVTRGGSELCNYTDEFPISQIML